ncbi:MAG: hypothetical protein IPI19_06155 [Ignavibacteriales bacterium]|nr:hypothetical protein [Ignavibacteriales bacterium]
MEKNSKLIKDVFAVQRFRNILFYELRFLDGVGLFGLYFFFGSINFTLSIIGLNISSIELAIILITTAAILFSPYILYVLIIEKKIGWIIFFFSMTIFPLVFIHIFFREALFYDALILIPLLLFYFYCYLIKFEVDKWLADFSWHQERLQQKKETEDRIKSEMIL